MATSTMSPQPALYPYPTDTATSPSSLPSQAEPTILEEVRLAQSLLRSRLAGALSKTPANISPSLLPTVPLIDLGPSFDGTSASRLAIASQIRSACLTTGFFQISNHSIPSSTTANILSQARRFFHDLPVAKKDALHIRHSPLFRGYEPADSTYVDPDSTAQPETKEAFNFGYEVALDPTGGDGKYVELDGRPPQPGNTNVWPAEKDLPGFYTRVAEYYACVLQLARHLFRLFALSLDLAEDYFDELTTHPGGIARLLFYPPADEKRDVDGKEGSENESESVGLGAHTDYECFTLLLADANPGLEILFPGSEATGGRPLWRACPVREGTLTVNVADFLQRWTGGLYKSTVHRVVRGRGDSDERFSVPFFFSINYYAEVEVLNRGSEGKSGKKGMKAGEYVLGRLRATAKVK